MLRTIYFAYDARVLSFLVNFNAFKLISEYCRILKVSTEELQHRFDIQLPETVKQLLTYARNFVEFCSYQALNVVSRSSDYLSDPEFRRLTYDMMLAWEAPSVETESENKVRQPIIVTYWYS